MDLYCVSNFFVFVNGGGTNYFLLVMLLQIMPISLVSVL